MSPAVARCIYLAYQQNYTYVVTLEIRYIIVLLLSQLCRSPIGPPVMAAERNHKLWTKFFIPFIWHLRKLSVRVIASKPLFAGVACARYLVARRPHILDHSLSPAASVAILPTFLL